MHAGQQWGIGSACKSPPNTSTHPSKASEPSISSPAPRLYLNMIVYICIYLCMKSEAWRGEFVLQLVCRVTLTHVSIWQC